MKKDGFSHRILICVLQKRHLHRAVSTKRKDLHACYLEPILLITLLMEVEVMTCFCTDDCIHIRILQKLPKGFYYCSLWDSPMILMKRKPVKAFERNRAMHCS